MNYEERLKDIQEPSALMIDIVALRVGDRVHYQPDYYGDSRWDNGIVKEIGGAGVRVVYHCGGDWKHYQDYTSALTPVQSLKLGWRFQ